MSAQRFCRASPVCPSKRRRSGMDCPGEFEIVLLAYDQVENATSIEAVERTLAELIRVYPDHPVIEELRWKLTDLVVERYGSDTHSRDLILPASHADQPR